MAAAKKKRGPGAPKKDLRAITTDYASGRPGRIYRDWQAWFENTWRNPDPRGERYRSKKAAKGGANRMMASKYHLTVRQIQNIVSTGDALMRDIATRGAVHSKKLEKQHNAFRQMNAALDEALTLMRGPAYRDLLNGCPMLIDGRTPVALASLTSDKARMDSLEYFTAVLAKAFLRAHKARISSAKLK